MNRYSTINTPSTFLSLRTDALNTQRDALLSHPSDAAEDLGVNRITDQFPVDGGEGVTRGQRSRQRLLDLQLGHVFDRRSHVSLGARDDAGESEVVLRQGSRLGSGMRQFLLR